MHRKVKNASECTKRMFLIESVDVLMRSKKNIYFAHIKKTTISCVREFFVIHFPLKKRSWDPDIKYAIPLRVSVNFFSSWVRNRKFFPFLWIETICFVANDLFDWDLPFLHASCSLDSTCSWFDVNYFIAANKHLKFITPNTRKIPM